ncbi:aminotransferase family protein [Alteribacillus bidgolensis]|uniref:Adenosylmethionine-8-amino-7-oxononanoate aminotransferase n=1 Tax=Alteribacillus bidgolensis TaxID=930129 RepID=A0A1G8NL71_9BACI|nr:aspartate aminotransferase family protein [Alteribacillus bidgolensis]SDI80953.1 Adenosylmethionine-8-amino-7-oxononanoate aminotransferase [Alteribacillus bidgolensis]
MTNEQKTQELAALDKAHFIHPTSPIKQQQEHGPSFIFTEGKGVYLKDTNGNKVIDGMSSLWNVNAGHGRKELAEAASEQMKTLAFTSSFSTFSNEPAIRLAAKIADLSPGELSAVFFTSGGSEANDTAYKLARHYWILKGKPEKKKIISRNNSYHGVAMGATSATGLKPFRDFTNSLAPDFYFANSQSAASFRHLVEQEGPETIAAFIAEPIQGAGGVHPAPENYFKEIRQICDEYGILFIADEVITGFGRTGTMFGMEQEGAEPDMMCFAKGVTSGYAPLGGVVLSKKMHNDFKKLSDGVLLHGYTYSGHPMSCAVALENIEIIEKEGLQENAAIRGKELTQGFKAVQARRNTIGEVRGKGLMVGLEIVKDQGSQEKFPTKQAPFLIAEAAKRGLICRSVVFGEQDALVFAPPLCITKEEVEKVIEIMEDCIVALEEQVLKKY